MISSGPAEQVRTFVAIELPPAAVETLAGVQARLAAARLPLRLVPAGGLHLTLTFLGAVPAAQVAAVTAAVQQGAAGSAPFALRAESTGMFPNARAPRVIWVGVQGDAAARAALTTLHDGIAGALAAAGFHVDGRFDPHLTLARVGDRATPAERAQIGALVQRLPAFPPAAFPVAQISIMRSDLRPGGAVYTPQARVALVAP